MKILILSPLFPPAVGGAAQYYRLLSRYLLIEPAVRRIDVITSRHQGSPWREIKGKLRVYRLLLPYGWGSLFLFRVFGFLFRQFQLVFVLIWGSFIIRPSIILIHSTFLKIGGRWTNLFLQFILQVLPVKVVLDVRDLATLPNSGRGFSAILCASENIFQKARQLGLDPAKLYQVPVPLALGKIRSTKEQQRLRPFLLFVGDIQPQKGVFELMQAFQLLAAKHTQLKLVFIGRNLLGSNFLRIVNQKPRVFYLGVREHSEVLGFMQAAELLVLPSRSEGMPRVVLEGLSLGKKVLFPAGLPELARACPEFALSQVGPKVIARQIEELLRKKLVCRYPIKNHNPQRVARKSLKIFQKVLDEKSAAKNH